MSLSHFQNISKPSNYQLTLSSFFCPGKQVPQATHQVPIEQQKISRKMVGLGVSVTEKMASVTQDGPCRLWDLTRHNDMAQSKQSKQDLQPVFEAILWNAESSKELSCGMQKAQRNPDVLWSTKE